MTDRPRSWHGLVTRRRRRDQLWRLTRRLSRKPLGLTGVVLLLVLVLMAVAAPHIAPADPNAAIYQVRLHGPSHAHLFGTDQFGRDVLSRVVYGARISMQIGGLAVVIGLTGGLLVGLPSGFLGGWTDVVLQRLMDAIIAFPALVLAMTLVAVLPQDLPTPGFAPSVFKIMLAIGFTVIPGINRVVRSAVLTVRAELYIDAARATGATSLRIMLRHVLPNVLAPVIVVATALLGAAILIEAALSYIGLGVPPDVASWGQMLSGNAQSFFRRAPYLAVFPGLGITLAVLSVNLVGDTLRDLFDPRLRGG
jgi:peptide/nickel transport system permease protein